MIDVNQYQKKLRLFQQQSLILEILNYKCDNTLSADYYENLKTLELIKNKINEINQLIEQVVMIIKEDPKEPNGSKEPLDSLEFIPVKTINKIVNGTMMIESILEDLKKQIYPNFKAAAFSVLNQKTNQQLISFFDKYQQLISKFNTLKIAGEYFYYQSSFKISTFSKMLIDNYFPTPGNLPLDQKIHNFLNQHLEIITMDLANWVNYYNNTKYLIKYYQPHHRKKITKINQLFEEIELIYFIITISAVS